MNRKELVRNVANGTGETQITVAKVLEGVLSNIQAAGSAHEEVALKGFGSFKTNLRPARKGHNPSTGKSIDIAAKHVVKFTPSQAFKDAVK